MTVRLKFRHIEGFRAVLQTGTATGAASLLNVTQPAVSQLMTEMEAATGFTLFDRRGGRLVPTSRALRLFDEVERCYTGLDQLNAFCTRIRQAEAQAVVLAAVPSLALTLVPKTIGRYMAEVRRDFFSLFPRHSNEALRMVGSQKADIGFGVLSAVVPGVHCEPISEYEAVCVLPCDHPLAARDVIHARDLLGAPFIIPSRSEGLYGQVEELFEREGVRVLPVSESPMSTATCSLVQCGVGVTLAEQGAAAVFIDRPVAIRRFEPRIPIVFYAYFLDRKKDNPIVRKFIEIIKLEARAMEGQLEQAISRRSANSSSQ